MEGNVKQSDSRGTTNLHERVEELQTGKSFSGIGRAVNQELLV